jgi:small subunit ribosomal protein S16
VWVINIDKIPHDKIIYPSIISGGLIVSVKIRLQRVGTKKKPFYRIIAVDSKAKRDGACIDQLGLYQPIVENNQFVIDEPKVLDWLKKGAQPTHTILRLLKNNGIWKKHKEAK